MHDNSRFPLNNGLIWLFAMLLERRFRNPRVSNNYSPRSKALPLDCLLIGSVNAIGRLQIPVDDLIFVQILKPCRDMISNRPRVQNVVDGCARSPKDYGCFLIHNVNWAPR